ncbi:P-loop containing nucleoside triphosphate hydrolase [Cordyceps javanica]|uniref:ubiquitinyl hydrolase 1 n=1 Tax=Cordyceps javanica TaxID=43265 RepID=A0A545UUP4_9HYPO|nr:P-loop containing nucleoside triphosphate hydrolase [Cordyceps javanica]TQW05456.1 P-loop containing nucleoside triphosphate hydrolase [Cordyceps javanica]
MMLEAVFDHLVLPPKLLAAPDDDYDASALNWELATRLIKACKQLEDTDATTQWRSLEASLLLTRELHNPVSVETLMAAFRTIADTEGANWLALHVAQQNAALIIYKNIETKEVVFETFEVSASAPAVLEAKHALLWTFPCRAVAIPMTEFTNTSFQETIAVFLEQATEIAFDQFAARAFKGEKAVVETRDSPSPAIVTEMLMSFLQAMGRTFSVAVVHKRVRDDVILGSSQQPWRRSPYWLMLRASVQRFLLDSSDNDSKESRIQYKLIICIALSHLLADCQATLHPERVLMLQAKVCRRLAKLQTEMEDAPSVLRDRYLGKFFKHKAFFESTVTKTKTFIANLWDEHKRQTVRPIPLLPRNAAPDDLILHLSNSGHKLRALLSSNINPRQSHVPPDAHPRAEGTLAQINNVANQYSKLVNSAQKCMSKLRKSCDAPEEICLRLARAINTYMEAVGSQYVDNAVLESQYLLDLFELWTVMDSAAIDTCPILAQYHPGFVPEALDMLCLTSRSDMVRLRRAQEHIADRIANCSDAQHTIFHDPHHNLAFAAVYMTQYGAQSGMMSLKDRIEAASAKSVMAKSQELGDLMEEHQRLTVEMQRGTCSCKRQPDGSLDVRGCKRCWRARCRKRLKIQVHEEFLPRNKADKAAVILELKLPRFLAAYRDATWRLRMLGWKDKVQGGDAAIVLGDFAPLKTYQHSLHENGSITLASRSKAYLQTHYRTLKMPKAAAEVLLPFGPVFTYYDAQNGIWAEDYNEKPWYHYLLGSWLPQGISDPFDQSVLYMDHHEHPSSYEIAANRDQCPPGMSHHEFEAYQAVISGTYRRWLVLVQEFGSSNLNISSASTTKCFSRLALQAGPPHSRYSLGKIHSVFDDHNFCKTLNHQIGLRLSALQSGRRDLDGISVLITFALRLLHLGPESITSSVESRLGEIRILLSEWMCQLRQDVRSTKDGETARKAAASAVCASLLCRQTFMVATFEEALLSETDAAHFFRASIALSENLITGLDALPTDLRHLLAQYMSWACSMSDTINAMALEHTSALENVVNETWTHGGESAARSFHEWEFCDGGNWLISRTVATAVVSSQTVHYHPIEGHLLIDGKALGRLPLEIQQDPGIMELFEGQHLLTRASGVAGMEFQIINSANNHEVHIGTIKNEVVIRARLGSQLLQYVPRKWFRSDTTSDLPSGLVDDCVHWLNLRTGELEMRRKPGIWTRKLSNWILDVNAQTVVRGRTTLMVNGRTTVKDGSSLVEPQSQIGRNVANIFRDFENPSYLNIYQPMSAGGRLSVEIKRLEMRFFVNAKGLLQSNQLKAEIDPVQDIGALYGLESKLVLRSLTNPRHRSVMIPIGSCSWRRNGPHVSVRILNEGHYALFSVDPLLGRLSCAPEPALFYLKAMVHALTSFPISDKLTGRTGTEEACLCLTAARSQPWKPLNVLPKRILRMIMNLSPTREYYPPSRRLYQRVTWDPYLTATIQHEQLATLAADILRQSQSLAVFDGPKDSQEKNVESLPSVDCLSLRGMVRRQVYERIRHSSDIDLLSQASQSDDYCQRGTEFGAEGNLRVYRSVKQLRQKSSKLPPPGTLHLILKKWRSFDGFDNTFDTLDIARILSAEASQVFGPIIGLLRASSEVAADHMAQLNLALFVFSSGCSADIADWLVAVGSYSGLRALTPPDIERFVNIGPDQGLSKSAIRKLVVSSQDDYTIYLSGDKASRRARQAVAATEESYDVKMEQDAKNIASWLKDTWPDVPVRSSRFYQGCQELELKVLDKKKAWVFLKPELLRLSQNHSLAEYISWLEATVQSLRSGQNGNSVGITVQSDSHATAMADAEITSSSRLAFERPSFCIPSLSQLFDSIGDEIGIIIRESHQDREQAPAAPHHSHQHGEKGILKRLSTISKEIASLHELVQPFKDSQNVMQQQYGQDLEKSIVAMAVSLTRPKGPSFSSDQRNFATEINSHEQLIYSQINAISQLQARLYTCHLWLEAGQLWPCTSPAAILEQLRFRSFRVLSQPVQRWLIHLGVLFTNLQHFLRMEDAQLSYEDKKLHDELQVKGHSNWHPAEYPEWLLLEIDNNILIRPLQAEVAKAIVSPQSGKTSVVIPMAAIALADTRNLCRVIVPKSLLLQTAQVLQSRIGGLIGRQVRHIPFSRRSPSDATTLSAYKSIHHDMLQMGGVMLCLPAHVLSFKLSGLQRLADHHRKEGEQMVEIQQWMESICRDVLDESDMTLSVHTQLIYPSGELTALDGHPYRWLIVEHLLDLVESHASTLQKTFHDRVVVVPRQHGFPIIHFITTEPEIALNELLVEDICDGRLPHIQLQEYASRETKNLIKRIISGKHVSSTDWDTALASLKDDIFGPKALYLLRGLISQQILIVCLKKKWNIQYGLHPDRQPIAVPFEAKGIPSPAAEYGHPDTTLILTCLAFYQQGLSKDQLKQGLQGVMQSDDAAAHYDRWVCSCTTLPSSLRYWNLIDPEDEVQVEALWEHLRFNRTIINHHLNNYVFPRFAKQFPVKLLASGWDIPLLHSSQVDGQRSNLTTGFSGTNDNKHILPQTIQQNDLPELINTNAQVLCHLLESRNADCHLTATAEGVRFDEESTLRFLRKMEIRVLIDAGAHILEMENHDVARQWLEIEPSAEGAIYFGPNSQIMVRSRFRKEPMPLIASPFANDIKACVVYIDEGHTRGTDLKLPADAKGAVTLSLGQTKDQTVQAAMRLRQLGTTQSVVFLASPEVHYAMLDLRLAHVNNASRLVAPTSRDVVRWLLHQSCKANEQMLSLYRSQCWEFCRRTDVLRQHPNYATREDDLQQVLGVIRQEEDQTLQDMYGPRDSSALAGRTHLASAQLRAFAQNAERMATHEQVGDSSALMEVEQEREVVLEVEHMREKETKKSHVALVFPGLDKGIKDFIQTGQLDTGANTSGATFTQAFEYVGQTKIGSSFGIQATASRLFVSREFVRTVARPINWILWSPSAETGLVIIPEEADAVIPRLRNMAKPRVWLLGYTPPVTKSMQHFNCLSYLTVPQWPRTCQIPVWLGIEVGILSGRLYFDIAEYEPLLAWLGLVPPSPGRTARGGGGGGGIRIQQPLQFLQEWLSFRRQTQDILYTPAGFVCQRQVLHEGHFFFSDLSGGA